MTTHSVQDLLDAVNSDTALKDVAVTQADMKASS